MMGKIVGSELLVTTVDSTKETLWSKQAHLKWGRAQECGRFLLRNVTTHVDLLILCHKVVRGGGTWLHKCRRAPQIVTFFE